MKVTADTNVLLCAIVADDAAQMTRSIELELASRRLLPVEAPPLRTPLAYRLVCRPQTLADPAARAFCDWLLMQ
ncbi:hypothetical protein D5041_12535 [Verminephrobacter aporrectodeae subsp. tuberculatae]|uniref:LysR substrate binding domain-containing protein n=1 Tax=Verminephrobacter aporrectodeae subsp. tuberculatae TaxID=1110392 RepID=A0ABT3KQR4_9BURK|nr:hypothetical protein [Verminephrobacter aporrectodeae]MCW5220544.1 hypothetical protein [Verminephrobacter aporrectodeae subsp. tuberculatae]MCW5289840.1 hypothetical protein [Verminephrobacter aporrectodeae subsp. tuberculatae]MCW5320482.1 hypothetical protein [Verminephrobacter aporrectodeae subsp. tuberculatae]